MKRILVLGGGFSGLWSAVGAMRKLTEMGITPDEAEVVLVDQNPYHNIRVRNYESDLSDVIVPLDDVLGPIGVNRIEGRVTKIECAAQSVLVKGATSEIAIDYDRLVLALGSQIFKPDIPGLRTCGFDIDTYAAATVLDNHLRALAQRPRSDARNTVVIVGAGLTGIELAAEMPDRLRSIFGPDSHPRVIVVDRAPLIGSDMGAHARPIIDGALASLGVEWRLDVQVVAVTAESLRLSSGEIISAATTVWCGGMTANPLAKCVSAELDRFGRVTVDEFMRVKGAPRVFAAGDIAAAAIDGERSSVMSCQHGRPMGRYAGHNVAADLFGAPLLPLNVEHYVTCLDLGPVGAVYTSGWERRVVAQGAAAKQVKQAINRQRIYPPRTRQRADILQAGAPVVQSSPEIPVEADLAAK